jgi:hypothetical protein
VGWKDHKAHLVQRVVHFKSGVDSIQPIRWGEKLIGNHSRGVFISPGDNNTRLFNVQRSTAKYVLVTATIYKDASHLAMVPLCSPS